MNAPVQQRYLDARRRYETIQEQCIAAARPFDPRDIEGFAQRLVAAERQLGYLQAYQDMKQAEQALVAWAQSLAQLEAYQDLARLFQSYRYHPDVEARMIELCLSINVDDTSTDRNSPPIL